MSRPNHPQMLEVNDRQHEAQALSENNSGAGNGSCPSLPGVGSSNMARALAGALPEGASDSDSGSGDGGSHRPSVFHHAPRSSGADGGNGNAGLVDRVFHHPHHPQTSSSSGHIFSTGDDYGHSDAPFYDDEEGEENDEDEDEE